jgi:hypothetical protein
MLRINTSQILEILTYDLKLLTRSIIRRGCAMGR